MGIRGFKYNNEYWIEVSVSPERFITLDVDEFYDWASGLGIVWNVRATGFTLTSMPCFLFKREDDIIAFKLKFGL